MLFCSADYFVFLNTNNGSLSSFIGPSIIFLVVVAIHEACEFFINITIFPKSAPLTCQSSQHNSVLVVLVDSLLKLTVLGMGRVGWVNLTPRAHPCYHFGLHTVFRFYRNVLCYRFPGNCCDNGRICLPTACPLHNFCAHPADYTTWNVPSSSFNLHHRRSSAATREPPSHTLPCSGQRNGCNML